MKRTLKYILIFALLAGGAVLCAIRWKAWFEMPAEYKWTGDTLDYVIPYPSGDSIHTFLILGDVHSHLMRADFDTLAARVPDIDAVVQVGDFLDRGYTYYQQLFLREWTHSALYGLPVITCPGNHEYSKGLNKCLSEVWTATFDHPHNGPVGVPGASYYVDMPSVRFIVIDTNPLARMVHFTRTLTWMRQAMNTAHEKFIVVLMHHPVLSAAKGRCNPLLYTAFRHALGDADLVLAGHDHSYMRLTPFVVLNTAGSAKTQRSLPLAQMTDTVPVYGVLKMDTLSASGSCLQFNVYRLDDATLIDSLYVKHD